MQAEEARAALEGEPGRWERWRESVAPLLEPLVASADRCGLSPASCVEALGRALARQVVQTGDAAAAAVARLSRPGIAEDVLLAWGYRQGHPVAIELMQRRYQASLRSILVDHLPAAALAVAMAEVWSVLWERIPQFCGRSRLRTWMHVVVTRWCFEHGRRRLLPTVDAVTPDGRALIEEIAAPIDAETLTTPCQEFRRAMDASALAAVVALPPPDRVLLRLRFLHQMPLESLRHCPEIYPPGETVLPVYGMTRRIQRVARRLQETLLTTLRGHGFDRELSAQLLGECDGAGEGLVAELFATEVQTEAT